MILDEHQRDILSELINVGIGRGAASLNEMLNSHISLSVPTIDVIHAGSPEMKKLLGYYARQSSVGMSFSGGFTGNSLLTFSPESAKVLVSSLLDTDTTEDDMDSLQASALVEVGNIVINSVLGSLSNGLGVHLCYTVPVYEECALSDVLPRVQGDNMQLVILAKTIFKSQSLAISGEIFIFLELSSLYEFLELINHSLARFSEGAIL